MTDTNSVQFDAFIGIPYAKPPVGKLRFKSPIPVDPWTGEYNATSRKPSCMQSSTVPLRDPIIGNEDCLYLNVYRPKENVTQSLPVMVFIHGGGYFSGSADPQLYGPERILATKLVILVTIQYRLGVFGFLSTGDAAAPGNAGMRDQVLALRWVQRNIATFGGDPQAVTLFGESAGGASVQLHMMSPLSRGLFQRAILMSGSALAVWSLPVDDPLALARRHAKLIGVSETDELTTAELVDVLQNIDANVLVASEQALGTWFDHPIVIYRPTIESAAVPVEDRFLTDDPGKQWTEGRFMNIPILLGTVPNEGAVVSLPILHNQTIMDQFNENLVELLPVVLALNASSADLGRLKERYFPNAPSDRWVSEESADNFTEMVSDALIKYPTLKTLQEYLSHPAETCRETTLYSFEFVGRHSFSSIYVPSDDKYGVCHQDELLYLFRMPDLFPDFPSESPETEIATVWTSSLFLVNFAVQGATPPNCGEQVETVKFENAPPGNATESKVSISRESGLSHKLQEMVQFWTTIYRSSYVAYH
ncbi:LOW QUALITY PROTEIN: juvenile hormone esterase-like [Anopheles ziemanni]|uniref:LOW QUALITY PROTEIN: juvenile hormone esterase-like n=1 Tax=Anopheles coustani TaxID=139045 RepID=UPI002657C940|nr:LOW QUALITY PROTEIN: juvenile hormone esterase-like [Anopheles coustani]XP_058168510.1 LOW QUALITY PROTEIN: juvenile hormone esterase-like [Anopheles ziemanni]